MDEAFRDWQYNFRLTHKRRPTLREMQSDPRINSILEQRRKKRESVYTTVFKYKIEWKILLLFLSFYLTIKPNSFTYNDSNIFHVFLFIFW